MTVAAQAARALAIAIAILAIWDPSVTVRRPGTATVAVPLSGAADSALVSRARGALSNDFHVSPEAGRFADAILLVEGAGAPAAHRTGTPVFAVTSDSGAPSLLLTSVGMPQEVALHAQAPVMVSYRAIGARGREVIATLQVGGVTVHSERRTLQSDADWGSIALHYTPVHTGTVPAVVTLALEPEAAAAGTDIAFRVVDRRIPVLFFDRRPSWLSTFVRRELEQDPRFTITNRMVTSRNVSLDAGTPPAALDDLAALAVHHAVVIGAPEELTPRDVDGLDRFMRDRGGAVLLLPDRIDAGPWTRLTGVVRWETSLGPEFLVSAPAFDFAQLRASEVAWPTPLPPAAAVIAQGAPLMGSGSKTPILWRTTVGRGALLVSGALDSWRYRSTTDSATPFWGGVLHSIALQTPPPLELTLQQNVVAPGARAVLHVALPGFTGAPLRSAAPAATVRGELLATGEAMRFYPSHLPGSFEARFDAPTAPGVYGVEVNADGHRGIIDLVVAAGARAERGVPHDALLAWSAATGGAVHRADELHLLAPAIRGALALGRVPVQIHPMRSPWWILPFAILLGFEWWHRRLRGLH